MKVNFFVGYSVILTMILNVNAVLIGLVFTSFSSMISFNAFALSDTEKLDEMNAKYGLKNPTRNHQSDTFDPKLEALFTQPTRDLSPTIGKVLSTPVPAKTIDLSGYNLNRSMAEQLDMAKNLSKTHGTPKKDAGSYKSEYSKSGTRQFKRDANGNLVMEAIEGVPMVKDLTDDDMLGAESQNPNYASESNKESLYGDNTKIFDEGKAINTSFKDPTLGNNASARGYRAITRSAQRGIDTNIPESAPWLKQSFDSVKEAQDPTKMFSSCTEIKKPIIDTISVPKTTEHKCQDITQVNKDFCEVERKIKIPVFSNSPGLRSCGVGCYEFDLDINVWKTSRCRSTPGDAPTASFTLNLNLSHGLKIKNVTLTGQADDHFLYQLNGQKLWESNAGSQSTSGNINAGSCNSSGSAHNINTDLTSRVQSITGPLAADGVYALTFTGDIRWKRNGGMASKIRFEVEDTSGEGLETKFIQTPDRCYDALLEETKLKKGLTGIYDHKEFSVGDEFENSKFTCTKTPDTPVCIGTGNLFGSVTKEQCLSLPVWPELKAEDSPYRTGMFVHKPPKCSVGTLSADGNSCSYSPTPICPILSSTQCGETTDKKPIMSGALSGALSGSTCTYTSGACPAGWKVESAVTLTCPSGGSVDNGQCVLPSIKEPVCPSAAASVRSVKVVGVEDAYCSEPPQKSPNPWICSADSFNPAYCSVTLENYLDGNDVLIKTVTDDGFPISPIVDEEGKAVIWSDFATCNVPNPNNPSNPPPPKSFCTFDEYENIIEGPASFPPSLLAEIPQFYAGDKGNKTWKVNLKKYRCDPSLGQIMCRIDDVTGEKICTTWEELRNKPDQCAVYKSDPTCSEVSSTCPDGWYEPITKRCMSETKRYECKTSTPIDFKSEVTTNTCAGMLPCLGGDCDVTEPETNPNFVKAMVASSVIDHMQDDSKCEDPSDPTSCRIFNGTFKYCSWETTGLGMDCCEEAKGVDVLGYVVFSIQMMKVAKMAGSGAYGTGVQGMYKTLSTPINSATSAISSWANTAVNEVGTFVQGAYSSTVNSLMGSSTVASTTGGAAASVSGAAAGEGLTATMQAALSALQNEVFAFVYNMLPETLAKLIFTETTKVVGTETVKTYTADGALSNALGTVMAVYAAYQMIKLALTLLTACDDIEMDMGVKLAQRTCFRVGGEYCAKRYPIIGTCMQARQNYCCYSSILSRIVMKESYSQLNINPLPYGNEPSKGPQMDESCQGLTFEQFGNVDFEAPSMQTALQEWIGLMLDSKLIPTETSEQSLTGGASTSDKACPSVEKPVMECYTSAETLKQVCEHKRDASGNIVYELVAQECIKNIEPGQIWNAAGRKVTSERTKENVGTAQDRVQESKNYMRDAANNLDCSVYPRPHVCNYGFDPRDGG